MKRPITVNYSADGKFWIVDIDETTGNRKGPTFGPFSREEAIFQLAVVGVPDYRNAYELLETAERDHHATHKP